MSSGYQKHYDDEWNAGGYPSSKMSDGDYENDLSEGYFGGIIGRNAYNTFVAKVLSIVTLQLLVTAVISVIIYTVPAVRDFAQGEWVVTVCFILAFVLLIVLFFVQKKWPANVCVVTGFTVALGFVVGACASCFSVPSILIAFGLTVLICVIIISIALFSKKDFSFLQGLVPLVVLMLMAMLLVMFLTGWGYLGTVISFVLVFLFSLMLLINVSQLKKHDYDDGDWAMASVSIYMDIINMFLAILRLTN